MICHHLEQEFIKNGGKWREKEIGELFDIKTGRDVIIGKTQDGKIPLVSHQCNNNGIVKNVKKLENRILFNYKNTISLADRGLFHATTQIKDFHIGTRVKVLIFKDSEKKENIRLFFVNLINKLQFLFKEYLDNATDKLPKLKILIPYNKNNKIDYEYMELYIKTIKENYFKKIKNHIKNEFESLSLTEEEKNSLGSFQNKKMSIFKIENDEKFKLFNVVGTKSLDRNDIKFIENGINFIGRTNDNNGIQGKIELQKFKPNEINTITATVIGNKVSKYQEQEYYCSQNINKLKPLFKINKFNALYFVANVDKYLSTYNNQWDGYRLEDLQNHKILLPIKNNNEIDFDFMENYIKALMKILYKKIVDNFDF